MAKSKQTSWEIYSDTKSESISWGEVKVTDWDEDLENGDVINFRLIKTSGDFDEGKFDSINLNDLKAMREIIDEAIRLIEASK